MVKMGNETKERPILFSGAMVRAILEGRKTQTRRIIKPQPFDGVRDSPFVKSGIEDLHGYEIKEKYAIGDRLWVRETWQAANCVESSMEGYVYAADVYDMEEFKRNAGLFAWCPPIYMPRAASRILLEITDVRVERLQDISETDAIAEGITGNFGLWRDYVNNNNTACDSPTESYKSLWQSINGPDSWQANPWVWVIEFKKI